MNRHAVDTATIPGWGVDADPENDPTFPIRHQEDQKTRGRDWLRPAQQHPDVEILQSIEHIRMPAVVGTSTPPRGLSGAIRRYAFRRSESDWWHWLMLMGADRLNVVEGVVQDLARGKVPNVPGEMGARAEWRHNKKGFALKTAGAVAIGALLFVGLRRKGTTAAAAPGREEDHRPSAPVVAPPTG